RPHPLDLDQTVLLTLDENDRDVPNLRHGGRRAERGRGDRGDGRPQVRVLDRQVPAPAAAHRVTEQIDAVRVDRVLLADDAEDVPNVLLAQLAEVLRVVRAGPGHERGTVPAAGVVPHRGDDDIAVLLGQVGQAGVADD